jgi:hypothetical protein
VSVFSGSTFQLLALISLINPRYFSGFYWILSGDSLSLQYVNSMNCIVRVSFLVVILYCMGSYKCIVYLV